MGMGVFEYPLGEDQNHTMPVYCERTLPWSSVTLAYNTCIIIVHPTLCIHIECGEGNFAI